MNEFQEINTVKVKLQSGTVDAVIQGTSAKTVWVTTPGRERDKAPPE